MTSLSHNISGFVHCEDAFLTTKVLRSDIKEASGIGIFFFRSNYHVIRPYSFDKLERSSMLCIRNIPCDVSKKVKHGSIVRARFHASRYQNSITTRDEKWSPVDFPKNPQSSSPQIMTLPPRIYISRELPPRRHTLKGFFWDARSYGHRKETFRRRCHKRALRGAAMLNSLLACVPRA